jgi:hypothetical protein
MNLVWFYIKSFTKIELTKNRAALIGAVKVGEQNYINKYWCPRERQFVYIYTRKDLNLGYNSI